MKKIKKSSEEEMVLEFLKMELQSDRFSSKILKILKNLKLDIDIINNGNLLNDNENRLRSVVLGQFRGYKLNKELFKNYPNKIKWYWVLLDEQDLEKIRYINYSYWNELSNFTNSPLEAAKTIFSGKEIYGVSNKGFLEASDYLKDGGIFPPLIMITDMNETKYVILEGHKRLTAYALSPEYFKNVSVLLGYCSTENFANWNN